MTKAKKEKGQHEAELIARLPNDWFRPFSTGIRRANYVCRKLEQQGLLESRSTRLPDEPIKDWAYSICPYEYRKLSALTPA